LVNSHSYSYHTIYLSRAYCYGVGVGWSLFGRRINLIEVVKMAAQPTSPPQDDGMALSPVASLAAASAAAAAVPMDNNSNINYGDEQQQPQQTVVHQSSSSGGRHRRSRSGRQSDGHRSSRTPRTPTLASSSSRGGNNNNGSSGSGNGDVFASSDERDRKRKREQLSVCGVVEGHVTASRYRLVKWIGQGTYSKNTISDTYMWCTCMVSMICNGCK
jgi:hypothetical protein